MRDNKKSDVEGSKTIGIVIFVFIGLLLVGYTVYMFEAFKNQWFPFQGFKFDSSNIPINSVLPLGEVTASQVITDDIKTTMSQILEQNEDWYTDSASNSIPLPKGQIVLAPDED